VGTSRLFAEKEFYEKKASQGVQGEKKSTQDEFEGLIILYGMPQGSV